MNLSTQLEAILTTAKQQAQGAHTQLTQQHGSTKNAGQLTITNCVVPKNLKEAEIVTQALLDKWSELPSLQDSVLQTGGDLLVQQANFLQEAIATMEQGVLKPIELNNLVVRINSLASVYHFAFGDKNDRELAITEWVAALDGYPDWAVKQAIDELIQSYKPSDSPLTPAILLDKIKSYIKLPRHRLQRFQMVYSNGKIWNSKQEYLDFLKSESERKMEEAKQERKEREQAAQRASEIMAQNNKEIAEKEAAGEAKMQALRDEQKREWQERKQAMKKFHERFAQVKRLEELYTEFESILTQMGEV